MAKFIVVDEAHCLACRQCMTDCALAHAEAKSLVEAVTGETPMQPRVHVRTTEQGVVLVRCQHCEDAPCIESCPKDAISRAEGDGPVLIDADLCIGCRLCMKACPFDAISMSVAEERKVVKCDLCADRTEAGQEPACVLACPTKAIRYCELDEEMKARRRELAEALAAAKTADAAGEADDE